MTYLDAAYSILHAAGRPLRFEEITEAALGRKLISPQGLTPEATMASRLYICLLYTSPSPRDRTRYRMPSSA